MRPVAQVLRQVLIQTEVRIIDLDNTSVDPTIVSSSQPYIEYRDLARIDSIAVEPSASELAMALLPRGDNCLAYTLEVGRGLHKEEMDIVRAWRDMMQRKDETGNNMRLTLREYLEALEGAGVVFVDSLEREVMGE